jgi:hypothetical protein
MGSYVSVAIPEDEECGMIESSGHSVAWLIVEMCSPWMDGTQDENAFNCIPSAAAKAADHEVPISLDGYNAWRKLRLVEWPEGQKRLWDIGGRDWYKYPFEEARDFLRTYGKSSSTDDIEFKL